MLLTSARVFVIKSWLGKRTVDVHGWPTMQPTLARADCAGLILFKNAANRNLHLTWFRSVSFRFFFYPAGTTRSWACQQVATVACRRYSDRDERCFWDRGTRSLTACTGKGNRGQGSEGKHLSWTRMKWKIWIFIVEFCCNIFVNAGADLFGGLEWRIDPRQISALKFGSGCSTSFVTSEERVYRCLRTHAWKWYFLLD